MNTTGSDDYYDLGPFHRSVTTTTSDAQLWFDRGLLWTYAFNHKEAAKCFEQALVHDPTCAMAHWGLAYSLGPNYNKPWELFDQQDLRITLERTHQAAEQAREHAAQATPLERALVEAVQVRNPVDPSDRNFEAYNQAYAIAMQLAYRNHPDDLDVATLYADALMNLTPWQLWDLRTGEPAPGARTMEAVEVLDRALAQEGGRDHPGLLHMYIHLWEMSGTPERAVSAADRLRAMCPDAGHLRHMPSHLDILIGDYRRAIASNAEAIAADDKYLAREGGMNFYTFYRVHDYHSLIYAAMFAGQSEVALQFCERMEASIPQELLEMESPPMADWLESFLSTRVHVLIRFGSWDDILAQKLPKDQKLYCVTTAMLHYAKGVALAATGYVKEAEQERALLHAAAKRVVQTRMSYTNKCLDLLEVGKAMLDGELEYRKRNYDVAFEHLRRSIALDDSLVYSEPWGWMQPTRHAYAALLLEQGHVETAAAAYAADLGFDDTLPRARQHPNNVWALHGYHECLTRLGRSTEARIIRQQLDLAVACADVPVKSSCFCRDPTRIRDACHC
ncbi:Tetratricopeptide repeat domain protein [Lasiodiplodia theobromae]|uniref:Tetratricopeptide repeat domain protein n=1 Tax=Lasiodiplodia theobromae TaxID=45133 RepID=UPI0015C32A84|nr:Tetratricopeptide repeat domain protein [Lasiodiplodia theobromae]KAF4539614.1 Tetratricopeptide repeat domain protein [Lasiodiplodia theobromae]